MEWIEILHFRQAHIEHAVSTLAVEWIEIAFSFQVSRSALVSTLAVEWIEILRVRRYIVISRSPPSRWSGLKLVLQ